MKRIIAAAAALTIAATVSLTAAQAAPPSRPVVERQVRLISAADGTVRCLSMERDQPYVVEQIDLTFRYRDPVARRWVTVWQAADGLQFTIVQVPQNQPWACWPNKQTVRVPSDWTDD